MYVRTGVPQEYETQEHIGQLRFVCQLGAKETVCVCVCVCVWFDTSKGRRAIRKETKKPMIGKLSVGWAIFSNGVQRGL